MFPRVVVLLLIPTLLLQGSSFAHSHAGTGKNQSSEHARVPHFHVPGAGTHSHHHDDGGHHHGPNGDHHPPDDGDDAPEAASTPTPENESPCDDHDSDAVFITAVDAVAAERSQAGDEVVSFGTWIVAGPSLLVTFTALSSVHLAINCHPPPLIDSLCPLYVQHRSLVI